MPEVDAPTRGRVARTLLELGPSTAAALAERLLLTPAAVRRHLDHMLEQGAVEARERLIEEEMGAIRDKAGDAFAAGRWDDARSLFTEMALADDFEDFLTIPAYERMP